VREPHHRPGGAELRDPLTGPLAAAFAVAVRAEDDRRQVTGLQPASRATRSTNDRARRLRGEFAPTRDDVEPGLSRPGCPGSPGDRPVHHRRTGPRNGVWPGPHRRGSLDRGWDRPTASAGDADPGSDRVPGSLPDTTAVPRWPRDAAASSGRTRVGSGRPAARVPHRGPVESGSVRSLQGAVCGDRPATRNILRRELARN
jgi:hypothetical protein